MYNKNEWVVIEIPDYKYANNKGEKGCIVGKFFDYDNNANYFESSYMHEDYKFKTTEIGLEAVKNLKSQRIDQMYRKVVPVERVNKIYNTAWRIRFNKTLGYHAFFLRGNQPKKFSMDGYYAGIFIPVLVYDDDMQIRDEQTLVVRTFTILNPVLLSEVIGITSLGDFIGFTEELNNFLVKYETMYNKIMRNYVHIKTSIN